MGRFHRVRKSEIFRNESDIAGEEGEAGRCRDTSGVSKVSVWGSGRRVRCSDLWTGGKKADNQR